MSDLDDVPPGQDASGPPMTRPDIPPYVHWTVTLRQPVHGGAFPWVSVREISAHDVELSPNGTVIRFVEWYYGNQGQPEKRVVLSVFRPMDGWVEYEEHKPSPIIIGVTKGITLQ